MKKLLLTLWALVACSTAVWAQEKADSPRTDRCGSPFDEAKLAKYNPAQYQRWRQLEQQVQAYRSNRPAPDPTGPTSIDPGATVTIPVVVHVVYNNATQNISAAQIQSQIDVLNQDYRRLNADRTNTPSQFSGVAADINIEFKLACVDPQGNPTSGIIRTSTSATGFAVAYNADMSINETATGVKYTPGAAPWPSNQYLNVWTCNFTDQTLGYATFPWQQSPVDGIVLAYNATGTTGTLQPRFNKGRTATHEIGHWLNVFHIWGDANCGNDQVADTPTQQTANFNCPAFPHVTCSNQGDMSMNYMDYTDDACMNLFTSGQRDRMRALFSTGGARESFISNKIQQQSAYLCGSGPYTFSVAANQGAAITYTWSVTGALQLSSGQGTNQITCTQNGTGPATISVSAKGYCDSKTVQVGQENASGTFATGTTYGCSGTPMQSVQFIPGGQQVAICVNQPYNFTFTSNTSNTPAVPVTKTGNQTAYFYFPGASVQIIATATNAPCGAVGSFIFVAPFSFTLAPNPVASELTVTAAAPALAATPDQPTPSTPAFEAELYDSFGRKLRTQKSGQGKAVLNVRELPNGLYTLRVGHGKGAYSEHVQIVH